MAESNTGADVLAEALIASGVSHVFGFPGDTGVALYDALFRRRERIRHVLARDERAAASMADGYARVTNRVGVVEASSGGGATFLVGGLGEPYAASVPLLVITSDIHRSSRGSGAITEIDQVKLFSAVTKAQRLVEDAAGLGAAVEEALVTAVSGRPGPVSLIIPEDVLDESAVPFAAVPRTATPGPAVSEALWREAVSLLGQAYQPVIYVGSGVHLSETWAELKSLAEQCGAAVATSIHGKGSFPERHPLSLGVAGANGARDYANEYLAAADVVLMLGTRANSTDTDGFTSPPRTARVIHADIDPRRAGRNYPGSVALVGDLRHILPELRRRVGHTAAERRVRVEAFIRARRAAYEAHREPPPTQGFDPRELVEVLQDVLGPNTRVFGEPGTPTPYLSAYWQSPGGVRDVVLPRGHGAMGFAIPAAVGAYMADPKWTTVAMTTDGSFGMACGELDSVARLHVPLVILHLSNGSLGWIKALQHFYLDRRYFGVDLGPVDAVRVAEGFGLPAARVHDVNQLRLALMRARDGDLPLFIDIEVPEEFSHLPPVSPWAKVLAGQAGRPVY
jgi:acetolactate synthase-1/2/3 large subunit